MRVPDDLSGFRKEVGIIVGLSHPNLIKYFDCGIDEDCKELYSVMEMSLSDMWEKCIIQTPLPYVVAIDIMLQIGNGMWYLHDMHVAHLDLKPSNVLLSFMNYDRAKDIPHHFNVKLIDFGISKTEVQSKPQLQKSKYTIGTPRYMALEVWPKSLAIACPFQADVWSFAMTCSEMLSHKVPFHHLEYTRKIPQKLKNGERPELPINYQELTKLIEECWRYDHLQRPTFSYICKRLLDMKKMFMNGTYLSDMVPQFDGIPSQKISTTLKASNDTNYSSETVLNGTSPCDSKVVGLENKIATLKHSLKSTNTWGIIGTGGIGKTTLAKAIFDDVRSTYDASCFVGQLKNRNALEILREILPKLGKNKGAEDLVDAHEMMEDLLNEKKVLLILDDIKDETQVDDIIPMVILDRSKDSTLILTTRDWSVIENRVRRNGKKLEMSVLDGGASKILFDNHSSFWDHESRLSTQFDDMRSKIVEACKGLPLSLKVMGAYLRGKERLRSWERTLERMKRGRSLD